MGKVDSQTTDSIRNWYERGCLLTLYLPAPSAADDADEQFELRLKEAADEAAEVAESGVVSRLIDALRTHGHTAGRGLVAVADDDGAEVWVTSTAVEMSVHPGPLPTLSRLIAARQTWVPHMVVLLDRVGADLEVVSAMGETSTDVVDGASSHLTKSNPGGWSQQRFQQRAEEHWQDNAELVATRVAAEAERHGIDLILITGTAEMLSLMRDRLPTHLQEGVVDLGTGSRAQDGSEDLIEAAVNSEVKAAALERRTVISDSIAEAIGQGVGATGRTDVLRALFEGRAAHVLLERRGAHGLFAHVGPDANQVAADSAVLHSLDLDATRVALSDAVIRAALATGADVTVVEDALLDLTDGVGATLRGPRSLD